MTDELFDAKINGEGAVAGGTYGVITLNGAGTVTGDVVCRELRMSGAGRCRGAVKADIVTVNGACTFDGPVQAGEFAVNGSADVHAGVGAGVLRIRGSITADGGIHARDIDLKGDLRVGAGVQADRLFGEGRFAVRDALAVGDVDLRPHGRSSAADVTCDRMILRAPEGVSAVLSAFVDRELTVTSVVGGELQLINTVASLVRGARVTLGDGCRVGRVEYSETLHKLAGVLVTEEMKVEAG